jgi:hypothetical protein
MKLKQTTDLKEMIGQKISVIDNDTSRLVVAGDRNFIVVDIERGYYDGVDLRVCGTFDIIEEREIAVKLGLTTRKEIEDSIERARLNQIEREQKSRREQYLRLKSEFEGK